MGDEEDRNAFAPQGRDDPEETSRLMSGERRRRFVHDQDANAERERLRDLEGLLRRDGETARRRADVEARAEPLETTAASRRIAARSTIRPRSRWLMKMFSATERSGKIIGSWYTAAIRGPAPRERCPPAQTAVDIELPGVGLLDAGHDLDERRFPRAVSPEQGVDLAA